jgi:hypothetical protein
MYALPAVGGSRALASRLLLQKLELARVRGVKKLAKLAQVSRPP